MNNSVDEKKECAKKIMHAIGELPDDMISKANPENWKDGIYIGNESVKNSHEIERKKGKLATISGWILTKRKMVACVATLFLCVVVAGVWKMNSIDEHIQNNMNNDSTDQFIENTYEPQDKSDTNDGVHKKTKKNSKDKKRKEKKKTKTKSVGRSKIKDNDKNSQKDDVKNTFLPEMKQYEDEGDSRRRGTSAKDDDSDKNNVPDTKVGETAMPVTTSDSNVSSDYDDSEESITAYKIDGQGNKTSVNLTSSDETKLISIIDGKKYSSEMETYEKDVILKYKRSDYYYDSKAKMLIVSGKGAKLSESENAELKTILKLD